MALRNGMIEIIVDCREWTHRGMTGIGRVLKGLLSSLAGKNAGRLLVGVYDEQLIPEPLCFHPHVRPLILPPFFLLAELMLSVCTYRNPNALYLSPYPKLPLFGVRGKAVHMVHDVLDLTFPAYRNRRKVLFDRLRLQAALRRADLTWYVSRYTLDATKRLVGHVGRRPRVRYSAVDDMFRTEPSDQELEILAEYNLEPGYILCVGNGMPHKNVGLLLACETALSRPLVFVGVRPEMEAKWLSRFSQTRAIWLRNLPDRHLPCVMRNAFCLVQPSFVEGFGFPPLEAMACGTPALVSDIPVLRETTGGCAWVANPHRHDEWVFAIQKLETAALRGKMIDLGLRYTRTLQGDRAWSKHIADLIALQGARS